MSNEPASRADEDGAVLAAAKNILPYLLWTIGPESPGYHPTMPSAVAAFESAYADALEARRTPSPPDGMRKALEDGLRPYSQENLAKLDAAISSPQPAPDSASPDKVRDKLAVIKSRVDLELSRIGNIETSYEYRLRCAAAAINFIASEVNDALASLPASPRSEDQ